MLVGNSPERRYGASKRLGSSAKERRGCGESHRALAGDGTARRTVGDEDPRRRRWLVAEEVVHRSGRLGVASNGLRWVRRTSGWRPIPSAERGATGRRSSEASAMAARICARFGDGLSRKGVREVYRGAARARGGLGGVFEGGVRLDLEIVAAAESRGASRRNRRAVEEGSADRWVPRVSGGETRPDRSGGSDRAVSARAWNWAGARDDGPRGNGRKSHGPDRK